MKLIVVLAALAAVATASPLTMNFVAPAANAQSKHWAVIVAGSNTWGNYRHQADACHAYQILIANGFSKDRIITLMYDDLAHNPENPTPGKIINQPGGPNVYENVQIDYRGTDVNPNTFVKVLKGDAAGLVGVGSGRVLQSGPNDHVFVNFVDHGGPGIIAFGSQLMSASTLNQTLEYMYDNKMYKKLVFYMEACESGSMFQNILGADKNIYATTAADPNHSSYACYYDNTYKTYLGDVYSVNWMQNSDASNLKSETLQQQFQITKKETNTSEVCEYGDMTMGSEALIQFQGDQAANQEGKSAAAVRSPMEDAVDARDVPVAILRHRIADATSSAERAELQAELARLMEERDRIQLTYIRIIDAAAPGQVHRHLEAKAMSTNFECVEAAVFAFHDKCFNLGTNDYASKFALSFASMCDSGVSAEAIVSAIEATC